MRPVNAWIAVIACIWALSMPGRTLAMPEQDDVISRIDSRMATTGLTSKTHPSSPPIPAKTSFSIN